MYVTDLHSRWICFISELEMPAFPPHPQPVLGEAAPPLARDTGPSSLAT